MFGPLTDYHSAADEALFRALNSGGVPVLDAVFSVLTDKWFGIAVGLLFVVWVAVTKRWGALRWAAALILAIAVSDFVGFRLLKPLFARLRPCYALPDELVVQVVGTGRGGALPSLHAGNLFAFAFVAARADRRLWIPAYIIAFLVAYSRVYVGVHWPTDIIAGALWGSLVGWSALRLSGLGEKLILRLSKKQPAEEAG